MLPGRRQWLLLKRSYAEGPEPALEPSCEVYRDYGCGCGSKEVSGQGGSMTCAGVNGVRVGRCGVNTRVVPPDSGPFGDGSPVFFV